MTPLPLEDADPGSTSTRRDPAASMSLLTHILANPVDAGYHAYSREKFTQLSWGMRIVVLVLAVALGAGSVFAVRQLTTPTSAVSVADQLRNQVEAQQATVNSLEGDVTQLSARLAAARTTEAPSALTDDPDIALANGLKTVEGPGLEVTLADAPQGTLDTPGAGAVRDQDLRMVVNALWSAGAEAVTVNGIRLGPGTFIRTAGASILVNVEPITSPYTVRAIGDANALSVALVRGATGDYLSSVEAVAGITVDVKAARSLTMDARELRTLMYVSPLGDDTSNQGEQQ